MPESNVLAPFKEMIEREDSRLDLKLGWRFLYTPARTLAPETRLAFVALNPGDDKPHDPILCVEKGNAYRIEVEDWWGARQQAGLQTQVRLLYEELAKRIEGATWKKLMDEQTLALNFCPFRSQRWNRLDRQSKKELIAFSQVMWARVLEIVEPSVIVCLGNDPDEVPRPCRPSSRNRMDGSGRASRRLGRCQMGRSVLRHIQRRGNHGAHPSPLDI